MNKKRPTVAVLIPTYRPDKKFARLLMMLQRQTYPVCQMVIMNTEKSFWNDQGYEGISGLEVHHLTREAFDHGGTRRKGMEYIHADVCICMTQDAVPADDLLVEKLVGALGASTPGMDEPVAVSYARQLPDKDCRVIERCVRGFNYPRESRIKTSSDLPELGVKTYFCSNVCAAYDMEIYNRLDGFIERTIFNEDMLYAAQVIEAGYGVAYCAEAQVIHSHNYGCFRQLQRNFDLAVSQADHPEVFLGLPSEGEGIRMVKQTARYLRECGKSFLIPYLILQSAYKYMGYQLGKHYFYLPKALILHLTMNKNYWRES